MTTEPSDNTRIPAKRLSDVEGIAWRSKGLSSEFSLTSFSPTAPIRYGWGYLKSKISDGFEDYLEKLRDLREREYLKSELCSSERSRDLQGELYVDPQNHRSLPAVVDWLCRAQDNSASKDGGVARHYSLLTGWGSSYPETTGYIIPTLLKFSKSKLCVDFRPEGQDGAAELRLRVQQMSDWLCRIQLSCGGFQGGKIGDTPCVPVVFNTGQILFGLAAAVTEFGEAYHSALGRAADWLVQIQDPDGLWRKHHSPFAQAGERAFDTHVAWGLLEAGIARGDERYIESAFRNLVGSLRYIDTSGFVNCCCLTHPDRPLTHTLGYFICGLVEGYRYLKEDQLLDGALRAAVPLLRCVRDSGYLHGRIDRRFKPGASWNCITGSVQLSWAFMALYEFTNEKTFFEKAQLLNRFVRETIFLEKQTLGIEVDHRFGGIKAVYPISGRYNRYQYLNWAAKFFIDAGMYEQRLLAEHL